MKRLFKVFVSFWVLTLMIGLVPEMASATTRTAEDGVGWARSQVGKSIDYDGAYGAQCVDLTKAYYSYLGVSPVRGNGIDYSTNALPSGWTRTKGGRPSTGDILVFSGGGGAGHVAIYISDSEVVDQNLNNNHKVCKWNYRYDSGKYGPYWGCIHPNFAASYHNPEGYFDVVEGGDGTVRVRGWALDRDDPGASIDVHVYIDGEGHNIGAANLDRPDVNNALGVSGKHGYDSTIKTSKRGAVSVRVYGINRGGGTSNTELTNSPRTVTVTAPAPSGTVDITEDTYTIRSSLDTSMCLDVAGVSKDDKANLWLWKWNGEQGSGSSCEKFIVKPAGDGTYYIIATHSNKAVEVYGASAANGANVSQYAQNQSNAQRWYFVKNSDGTYSAYNKVSGLAMDVADGKMANGTNIRQWTPNGAGAQKFYLVPIDASKWNVSVASQTYTGKALTPEVKVAAGGMTMKQGRDYTVKYSDNVNVGNAAVTIASEGGFSGSKAVTFAINAKESPSSASKPADSKPADSKPADSKPAVATQFMHRLYNPNSGEHFYTADDGERDGLVDAGWTSEGDGWTAPASSNTPVYRMYNPVAGEHHYTPDASERDSLIETGWNDEGVGWYSAGEDGIPLYRDYNPNAFANNHNYTASWDEHAALAEAGWIDEGIAWYGV